jgi:two-component system nitrogen regulation response regulator NtrX
VVLEEGAIPPLQDYPWPGNVRELRNLMERLIILAPGPSIAAAAVLAALQPDRGPRPSEPDQDFGSLREGREDFERRFIARKLRESSGNVVRAAQMLGLERSHLYRKMRAYGLRTGVGEEEI